MCVCVCNNNNNNNNSFNQFHSADWFENFHFELFCTPQDPFGSADQPLETLPCLSDSVKTFQNKSRSMWQLIKQNENQTCLFFWDCWCWQCSVAVLQWMGWWTFHANWMWNKIKMHWLLFFFFKKKERNGARSVWLGMKWMTATDKQVPCGLRQPPPSVSSQGSPGNAGVNAACMRGFISTSFTLIWGLIYSNLCVWAVIVCINAVVASSLAERFHSPPGCFFILSPLLVVVAADCCICQT